MRFYFWKIHGGVATHHVFHKLKKEKNMAKNYKEFAASLLEKVGGKDNVTSVTHCMTRLRFNLKDESIAKDEELKSISGVIGVVHSGGQLQIIVGQDVPKVYEQVCSIGGFTKLTAIDEKLDGTKQKMTLKDVGSWIMDYMSSSMVGLIPVMVTAAMFKTVLVLIGPDMLKLISAESDLYQLLGFLYDAGFYFFPIYIGYTAALKLKVTPVLGMFMGAVLLSPGFVALAGQPFSVYGIPTTVVNYSQSVFPVLLSMLALSVVEKQVKKIMPTTLSTIFTPFVTMVIMVPIALCFLAPLGGVLGNYIGAALIWIGNHGGFLGVAVIAAVWEFLVMTGMHMVVGMAGLTMIFTQGYEGCVIVAGSCATWAAYGLALGAFFRIKNKQEKALSLGYFVSGILGGVTEPALFGIGFKYKKPFIALMIGGFAGGLYSGIMKVTVHIFGATNFLGALGYVAGGTSNLIHGVIGCLISMIVTAVLTYMFGFDKNSSVVTGE